MIWFAHNLTLFSSSKMKMIMCAVLISSFALQYFTIYPQWQKYSFVANANEVAQNFRNVLFANNYQKYSTLCITNNSRGGWGTEDGGAARLLYGFSGQIISTKEIGAPEICIKNHALILRNDGWKFFVSSF